ncbi:hypothetical protein L249_3142 [Ophiocordyceps polyrhachis-furcata BCC 54312]|uniref:Ubiquitin-like domain-containing protein n=1 Tax=Ophiocordyceps polyrhachis-furcata BCC 54312 TaxID=1330021 RepID=A0A367LP63_9HYPO|nr:hypothetical protein L249_3142 [Ophiocordyceps polyrhachis-furcata BCC 54312]
MTAPIPSSSSTPLHLTIRFSSSIPDAEIDVASPGQTTVLSLKHLLRSRLAIRNRLRLIHQGHILPDSCALSTVLKPLSSAPPPAQHHRHGTEDAAHGDDDDEGGQKQERPRLLDKGNAPAAAPPRVYVNCSIGDELSDDDLAAEESAAKDPPNDSDAGTNLQQQPWTRPRPRGFDRFLQAGFTPSEVSALRAQFAIIQSSRFLPDSMPSPDTMRGLEDAWIDSNAGQMPFTANTIDDDVSISSYIDVLVRGLLVGFFFPLGSFTWLLRGLIWNDKWRLFVCLGVILSVATGIVKGISEQH